MIGGRLTMRAVVHRDQTVSRDSWGQSEAPVWAVVGTARCFVWSNTSREVVDGDKTAMVEDMRAMFALGEDVTENDEISAVTDARGNVLIPGRLKVEGPVQRKHTHLEAALKRVG